MKQQAKQRAQMSAHQDAWANDTYDLSGSFNRNGAALTGKGRDPQQHQVMTCPCWITHNRHENVAELSEQQQGWYRAVYKRYITPARNQRLIPQGEWVLPCSSGEHVHFPDDEGQLGDTIYDPSILAWDFWNNKLLNSIVIASTEKQYHDSSESIRITMVKNAMDFARSRGYHILADQEGLACYRGMHGNTVEQWCLWMRDQRQAPDDPDDHPGYE